MDCSAVIEERSMLISRCAMIEDHGMFIEDQGAVIEDRVSQWDRIFICNSAPYVNVGMHSLL